MKQWIRDLLSDGGPSFGKFMTILMAALIVGVWDGGQIAFHCWWNIHRVIVGGAFVPILPESSTLLGQGGFILSFYSVKTLGSAISAAKGSGQ